MSLYSTVGQSGIVIDLSEMAAVQGDKERSQAILVGGISTKAVALELAKDGYCTSMSSTINTHLSVREG